MIGRVIASFGGGAVILALAALVSTPSEFKIKGSAHAQPIAPACGEFTPLLGVNQGDSFPLVHFFPKVCNKIMIAGELQTIPYGMGVFSGGVIGDARSACVEKMCGQTLEPFTVYRAYVFMDGGEMKMTFSKKGHRPDVNHGNEVNAEDPTQSLVGIVRTNQMGWFTGSPRSLTAISWFNRGHTWLAQFIGWGGQPRAQTCSKTLVEIPDVFIEFMVWSINDKFTEAYSTPNVYVSGTVSNTEVGGRVHVAIAMNGSHFSHVAMKNMRSEGDESSIHVVAGGAGMLGEEGYHKATLMMSTGGGPGCAVMNQGTFYTSPYHS